MDDKEIIRLYWRRCETAIGETDLKYGRLCYSIAHSALNSPEDAQETVNDTYLAAWNAIPPHRPENLKAFLVKLVRRISINRWYTSTARKRGGGQVQLVLDELSECESARPSAEEIAIGKEAYAALNRFLAALPETERQVFLRRYFLLESVAELSKSFRFSESKVTSMLHRTRVKLRKALTKEGYL